MSVSLETRISSEISWNWLDASATSSATRTQGNFRHSATFSSSGTPAINGVWHLENGTIPALSSVTHNLTSLRQRIYSTDVTLSFGALSAIFISNRSESHPLVVSNTATSTGMPPTNLATSGVVNTTIPPGGFFMLCNPQGTWALGSSQNEIRLQNAFVDVISYDIFINGTLITE